MMEDDLNLDIYERYFASLQFSVIMKIFMSINDRIKHDLIRHVLMMSPNRIERHVHQSYYVILKIKMDSNQSEVIES